MWKPLLYCPTKPCTWQWNSCFFRFILPSPNNLLQSKFQHTSPSPNFNYLTNEKIEQIPVENEDIISLIRKLNPNKANGSDGISGQMLLLCDDSVITP